MTRTEKLKNAMTTAPSGGGAIKTFRDLLERNEAAIRARLPKHIDADRMLKVALSALSKNPELLECTPQSVGMSVLQASELGLEPNGVLGEAYLVPFNNRKTGKKECQFIPGYRGLISLARRSGQIISIEARVVYENDSFECHFGLDPVLKHTPNWDAEETGAVKFVYAVAKIQGGGVQYEVMSRAQIDRIRSRSKGANSSYSPWNTDYDEMARKTVVRRLCKYLPVSVEMARALDLQAKAEIGESQADDIDGFDNVELHSTKEEIPELEAEPVDEVPA